MNKICLLIIIISSSFTLFASDYTPGSTLLFEDNFQTIDPNNWYIFDDYGSVTIDPNSTISDDGDSIEIESSDSSHRTAIRSIKTFSPNMFGENGALIITIGGPLLKWWEQEQRAYLADFAYTDGKLDEADSINQAIGFYSMSNSHVWVGISDGNDAESEETDYYIGSTYNSEPYQIWWYSTGRYVIKKGSTTIFDTDVDTPPTGGWPVPDNDARLPIWLINGRTGFPTVADYVRVEYIVVPSSYSYTPGAVLLFEDNFTSIDSGDWTTYDYDSLGTITIDHNSSASNDSNSLYIKNSGTTRTAIKSTRKFTPNICEDPDGILIVTIGGPLLKWWEMRQQFYLANFSYANGYMQEDSSSNNCLGIYNLSNSHVFTSVADGSAIELTETNCYIATADYTDAYQMWWYNNGRYVVKKGGETIFDTNVGTPPTGGWPIPDSSEALHLWISNGHNSFPTIVDFVRVEYLTTTNYNWTAAPVPLLKDDFNSIDANKWNIYNNYGTVTIDTTNSVSNDANSVSIESSSGSYRAAIESKAEFSPEIFGEDGAIKFTIGGPLLGWWEQQQKAYLADFTYIDGYLSEDSSSNQALGIYSMANSNVFTTVADGTNVQLTETDSYIGSTYNDAPYELTWYGSDGYVVEKGNEVIFDTYSSYDYTPGALVLLEDDFATVDTNVWDVYDSYGTVSIDTTSSVSNDGKSLSVVSSGSQRTAVCSKTTFSPNMYGDDDGIIIMTIGGPLLKWWEQTQKAYFADFTYSNGYLNEDSSSNNTLGVYSLTNSHIFVAMADSSNFTNKETSYYIVSDNYADAYQLWWYNSGRYVVKKGGQAIFDTDIDTPPAGGWKVPDSSESLPVWIINANSNCTTIADYLRIEYLSPSNPSPSGSLSIPGSSESLPVWLINAKNGYPTIADYVKVEYLPKTITIDIDVDDTSMEFSEYDRVFDPHYFGFTGNTQVKASLDDIYDDGFEIARFNAFISMSDIYSEDDANGDPIYDFTGVDAGLDPLVTIGFKFQLLLGYMPDILSKAPDSGTYYWNNRGECNDYAGWEDLVSSTIVHLRQRYGNDEVATWLFGTWNEADYGSYGRYQGQANLLKLFDHTVNAVKSVDSNIRIGGSGQVSASYKRGGGNWIDPTVPITCFGISNPTEETAPDWYDIVRHWGVGTNYATSETGTPVDYISSHLYDWGAAWPSGWDNPGTYEYACRIFEFMVATVRSYPDFENIPIIIDEWEGAPEPASRGTFNEYPMDGAYTAARQIQIMTAARDRGLSGMFHHCQTALPSDPNKLFAGWPALYTLQGPVRTAVGSALRLYNQLDGQQVSVTSPVNEVGAIAAISDSNSLRVIVFSVSDDRADAASNRVELNIDWPGSANNTYHVTKMMVDKVNANPRYLWEDMGKPATASSTQLDLLEKAAIIPESQWMQTVDSSGTITISTYLNRPAVQYFEFTQNTQ